MELRGFARKLQEGLCWIWKLAEVCNGALEFRAAGLGYECHAGHTTKRDSLIFGSVFPKPLVLF